MGFLAAIKFEFMYVFSTFTSETFEFTAIRNMFMSIGSVVAMIELCLLWPFEFLATGNFNSWYDRSRDDSNEYSALFS